MEQVGNGGGGVSKLVEMRILGVLHKVRYRAGSAVFNRMDTARGLGAESAVGPLEKLDDRADF